MKRSFTANINGSIFYIDEDAFNLLNSYFEQLRTAFPGPEDIEIVDDIEARVAELLNERQTGNSQVVTLDDINNVIARVGSPSDLSEAGEQPASHSENATASSATPPPYYEPQQGTKRLFRDESNCVLGGVLSGIAEYYGWNVTLLRVLVVILAFTTWFFPCFIAYIVAWCVIPAAKTPVQQLEMSGQPVNPKTLSQQMLSTRPTETTSSQIGRILGVGFLSFVGIICGCMFIGFIGLFLWSLGALIGVSFFSIPWGTIDGVPVTQLASGVFPLFALFISLSALIFLGVILWAIGMAIFKLPKISATTLIVCGVTEIVLIVAAIISGNAMAATMDMF